MVSRGYSRVFGRSVLILLTLIALVIAGVAMMAHGASRPPAVGDWVVTPGEVVQHDNTTLDLRGDLDVMGTLLLDNCSLRVWSTDTDPCNLVVNSSGTLSMVNTDLFAAELQHRFLLRANEGCELSVFSGSISGVGRTFVHGLSDGGVYLATNARFDGTAFDHCYAGPVVDGSDVTLAGCSFFNCTVGACVANDGRLTLEGASVSLCQIGLLGDMSDLVVRGSSFTGCGEAVTMYGGSVQVSSSTFSSFTNTGLSMYAAKGWMRNCTFSGSDATGVVVHTSEVAIDGSVFSNLTVDIDAVYSDITVRATVHNDTYDEAIYAYRSTFNISDVTTERSYWGLRTYASQGACRNLTTVAAGFSVFLERSYDVLLEDLNARGYVEPPQHRGQRALFAVYSDFVLRGANIEQVRSGLVFDSTAGLVEDVRIANCTHQGVVFLWSKGVTLRRVTVLNASTGFHSTPFNTLLLEDCLAEECRQVGFNFSLGDESRVVRCTVRRCPIGMWLYRCKTRVLTCSWDMVGAKGGAFNLTYGLRCILSSPVIDGGTVHGGDYGMWFEGSGASVSNVTFRDSRFHCVDFRNSWSDTIQGCTFLGHPNGTAILVMRGSPTIRSNYVGRMRYGIAVYRGSDPLIEGNVVHNVSLEGIQVLNRTRATLRGNQVLGSGTYGIHAAIFAEVVSRDDVVADSGEENVFVHIGSTIDIQGARISGSKVGIHGEDSPTVRVAYCELRDNKRGVVVTKITDAPTMVEAVRLVVEGCYFVNQSSYCIGIVGGDLRVIDCNLLDNGAGVEAWNSTVELVDNTMVACWLFGLSVHDSQANWTVEGRCRLYNTRVLGQVTMVVDGGVLEVADASVKLTAGGSFEARPGSTIILQSVRWTSVGAGLRIAGSRVELSDVHLRGVSTPFPSTGGEVGILIEDSSVTITNATFRDSGGGLTLMGCDATMSAGSAGDCDSWGVLGIDSSLEMERCRVWNISAGPGVLLRNATLHAERVSVDHCRSSVSAEGSTLVLLNCTLEDARRASMTLEDAHAVLVNTTYEPGKYRMEEGGQLEAWWFVSVRVVWCNESELPDVVVMVEDGSGLRVAGAQPDAAGWVRGLLVLGLKASDEGEDNQGPHAVSGIIHGYTATTIIQLNRSVEVELRLVDEDPPVLDVHSPTSTPFLTATAKVEVYGFADDLGSGTDRVELRVDYSSSVLTNKGGNFSFSLQLADGVHLINLTAHDVAGNRASKLLEVLVETTPIGLWVKSPENGTLTNALAVLVRGYVSRENVTVKVNGRRANQDLRAFELEVILGEGENLISVDTEDIFGHHTRVFATVMVDRTPPGLEVETPPVVNTTEEWVLVAGRMSAGRIVTINGQPVALREGRFCVHYPVRSGESRVTVLAVDEIGNERSQDIIVFRTEPEEEDSGPNLWEAMPFLLAIPVLMVAEWYVLYGRRYMGGGGE